MKRVGGAAGVTAALCVALAGCAGEEDVTRPTSETSRTPSVERAVSPELTSVTADVETAAVSLESFYRGNPYPETTAEVVDTLTDAGLTLAPGNAIGGYVYDPDAVEFTLCVENTSGAWATYDTAPMTLRENGPSGGCPFD